MCESADARAVARQTELSVRAALGSVTLASLIPDADRESVARTAGRNGGAALAAASVNLLRRLGPRSVPDSRTSRSIGACCCLRCLASLATGLLCGLIPAITAIRADGRKPARLGFRPLRRTLVVLEVALSLVLLVCGGLLIEKPVSSPKTEPGISA